MDIQITDRLKTFRKEKGNTQEELATYLHVSIQAVSKWERGEGYPDITLLPSISAYYHKSVDELLGCSEIEQAKQIEEYRRQYEENSHVGNIQANIDLMRTALKEFPDNLALLSDLCHALFFIDKEAYLGECIEVGEKILTKSVDDQQRYATIQTLVYAYSKQNNEKKASDYAKRLPDLFCTQNTVLEGVLQGEALRQLAQSNIGNHIGLLDVSIGCMLRSKDYTPEERLFAYETLDKLYNLFLYDGNYGTAHGALHTLWMNIAREYAKLKNGEKTIAALEKAYAHAYEMDHFPSGNYTSLFADTGAYSKESFSRNFDCSYIDWLRETMEQEAFDFMRATDEWKAFVHAHF